MDASDYPLDGSTVHGRGYLDGWAWEVLARYGQKVLPDYSVACSPVKYLAGLESRGIVDKVAAVEEIGLPGALEANRRGAVPLVFQGGCQEVNSVDLLGFCGSTRV